MMRFKLTIIVMLSLGFLLSISSVSLAVQDSQPEKDIVRALDWSPDGRILAVGGILRERVGIFLYEDDPLYNIHPTVGGVTSIAWSPDGTKLAARVDSPIYDGEGIQIRDMTGQEKLLTISELGGAGSTYNIAWSADSSKIAFTAREGLAVWDTSLGKTTAINIPDLDLDDVQAFAWHPNSKQIFMMTPDKVIRLWDITTNAIVYEQESSSFITAMATSPDGTQLALGGSDGIVQVWDLATYETLYTLQAFPQRQDVVWKLDWSGDGKTFAAGGSRHPITIWDADSGELLDTIEKQTAGFLEGISFSPYGGRLAYSTNRYVVASPPLEQTIFDDYTESIHDGAVQIVVPAPSPDKLQSILELCGVETSVHEALKAQITANELEDFIADVSALMAAQMPIGCQADLLAVARALVAEGE